MPVNLITSMDTAGFDLPASERAEHQKRVFALLNRTRSELKASHDLGATLGQLVDEMLGVSKCKDFVVNKGHYFGTSQFESIEPGEPGLSDADKRALIAFLKTF
jgi:hypothetical protein